jgi:hypothetical protein
VCDHENQRGVACLAKGKGGSGDVVEDGGGHIVPLAAIRAEFLDGREYMGKKIEWNVSGKATADVLNAGEAKL